MFVIKLTDPPYSKPAFCIKDCIPAFGPHGFFSEDAIFNTTEEAEEHITTMLNSGWYRPDITRDNFEVVEVKQYPGKATGFFYYTEEEYKRFTEDTEDAAKA